MRFCASSRRRSRSVSSKADDGASGSIDIARAVAQLSVLALDPATAASVPDSVRVAPYSVSHADVAAAVAKVRGVPLAQVEMGDLAAFKENLSKNPTENIFDYIK